MNTNTEALVSTYCGNYPERDHGDCPSSVECQQVTLADIPAAAAVIGELPIQGVLNPLGLRYCSVARTSHPRDAIQSFTVGPRNADAAAQALAEAGYHVFGASDYVVHLVA